MQLKSEKIIVLILVVGLLIIPQAVLAREADQDLTITNDESIHYTSEVTTSTENDLENAQSEDSESLQINNEENDDDISEEVDEETGDSQETMEAEESIDESESEEVAENENKTEINDDDVSKSDTLTDSNKVESSGSENNSSSDLESIANENRNLSYNEVEVNSFQELKSYIENSGNGRYSVYYLNSDITTQEGGIAVPNNYSFTIDGTSPKTGKKHTLTMFDKVNHDLTDSIYMATGSSSKVEMRNINLKGSSGYGILFSESYYTDFSYDNVSFTGPTLSYNTRGKTVIKNSYLTQKSLKPNQQLISGDNISFDGEVTIDSFGNTINSVIDNTAAIIEVKETGRLSINSDKPLVNSNVFDMKPGSRTDLRIKTNQPESLTHVIKANEIQARGEQLTINTEEANHIDIIVDANHLTMASGAIDIKFNSANTVLTTDESLFLYQGNLTIHGKVIESNGVVFSHKLNAMFEESNVLVDIAHVKGSVFNTTDIIQAVESTIHIKGDVFEDVIIKAFGIEFMMNTKMTIEVRKNLGNSAINTDNYFIFYESDLFINVKNGVEGLSNISLFKVAEVYFHDAELVAELNDPKITTIFDIQMGFYYTETGSVPTVLSIVSPHKFSLFKHVNNASFKTQQINTWTQYHEIDFVPKYNEMPNYRMQSTNKKPESVSLSGNSSGQYTLSSNSHQGTKTISVNNINRFSMGYLLAEGNNPSNTSSFTGKANPGTAVRLYYNETRTENGYANDSGVFNLALKEKVKPGQYMAQYYWNNLYFADDNGYIHKGILELTEYPEALEFGTLTIPSDHQLFNRSNKLRFVVDDSRVNGGGWKLEARMVSPLGDINGVKPPLEDAIVFRPDKNASTQPLTNSPTYIHSVGESNGTQTVLEFDLDEGILLELYGANGVYKDVNYGTQIEWILTPLS